MNIKVHLLGALVDYLPDSARGQTVLSLEDKRIEVLQIGPAGEKMVRSAALISMSNRANGRTGMGAVMGSKNLKAVVVRGKQKPSVANPDAFKILQKLGPKTMKPTGMDEFGKYGTPGVCSPQHHSGGLPTYNLTAVLSITTRTLTASSSLTNAREGIGRESDTLPKKMFDQPLKGGRSDGLALDKAEWDAALDAYYRLCEWDTKTGFPTRNKLEALGLGWIVAENEKLAQAVA